MVEQHKQTDKEEAQAKMAREAQEKADADAAAAAAKGKIGTTEHPEIARAKADAQHAVEAAKAAEVAAKAALKKAQEDEAQAKKNVADAASKAEGNYEVIGSIWMGGIELKGSADSENNPVIKMTGLDAARFVAAGNLRKA